MQVEVVKCQTLAEPKTYDELEAENTWLKGALRESRRGKEKIERDMRKWIFLSSLLGTLIVLLLSGVITVPGV